MTTPNIAAIEASYRELTGVLPPSIADRIRLARLAGRDESIVQIEALRDQLIMNNPLDTRTAQLVHFAQLLALGEHDAAALHAGAAKKAGATPEDLLGVVELALITAGMPAYSRGIAILAKLFPGDQPEHDG
ncbi:carboxymuconolactone decarboxylase family protein [Ferrimicrobium sp.]|uniref:carboxymuconolactone decarboxylase family protein n=1 Tax=Ferrimicrobium sp. TaxID=2926050 RepID=UPI00261524E2|nr:carboxymuconolactone decarboxylase family protein [Ferrimicrobium sp.]